jgi:outer membrane protein OmpA-like peptidoglycan-associated protein
MKAHDDKDTQSKNSQEHQGNAGPQNKSAGASLTPPPFNLDASSGGGGTIQQKPNNNGGGVVQAKGFWDSVGDFFGTRDNEADLDLQEDIADFKGQNYGPITYTRPNISGSGFEASYAPAAERLGVEVRAKVRFADGLVDNGGTVTSPNEFMNRGQLLKVLNALPDLKTQVLPYFQWKADEKEIHKIRFMDNIASTVGQWENAGLSFQVNQAGWEGVVARPDIDIKISEGEAVTAHEDYGPFGMFTRINEQGSDHLQVEIVKQMNATDAATVNTIVTNYITNILPGMPAIAAAIMPPAGDTRGVRSYLGTDSGARGSNPGAFNNFMSLESDRSDNPAAQSFSHTVNFDHDSSDITAAEQARLDAFFSNPSILLQNPNGTVTVALKGFASAPGTTEYNTGVVDRRLSSVSSAINAKMDGNHLNIQTHVDPATQTNDSDRSAEADKLANPLHDPNSFRKVEIKVDQSGRGGQNVFTHEFGHVFGLGDEYVEVANGYNRPAGALADHDQLAKDAGVPTGAVVGNDARIMSTGNTVQAEHYSTFADALRQLTSKPWKVV